MNDLFSNITTIIPELLTVLAAGGWLLSRHRRNQEREAHEAEMAKKEAELTAAIRDSETKYTREALEIFKEQVVEPIRQLSERNALEIARYQGAISKAPSCPLYPACVILRELQSSDSAVIAGSQPEADSN